MLRPRPYGTAGSMIPCIHVQFQPIFTAIFFQIKLPRYHSITIYIITEILKDLTLCLVQYIE